MSTPLAFRPPLSRRATTRFAIIAAVSFSATSSAPTPLYHLYQETLQLSALTVTLIFAAYAFAMLAAFLTIARLSDYVGRRPMIFAALATNALALILFIFATSAGMLILARVVQGIATGIAMTTLGATVLDTDKVNGPTYNSLTAFVGLTFGSLLAGSLVAWAPMPTQLVYLVLLVVTLGLTAQLAFVPETTSTTPGALNALRPNVSVPPAALPALLRLLPLNVAAWALGGFYLSLMPGLVTVATGITSLFVSAAVVSTLTLTASVVVLLVRSVNAEKLVPAAGLGLAIGVAITMLGLSQGSATFMFGGTFVAGIGFGAGATANMRLLLPLAAEHERAGLFAAYFSESYLAFAIPAILAGLAAPSIGLVSTAYAFGAILIVLALLSLVSYRPRRPMPA